MAIRSRAETHKLMANATDSIFATRFLTRIGYARSVRPSVYRWYAVKTNERKIVRFSLR